MLRDRFFHRAGPFKVKELAKETGCKVVGDENLSIKDIATLESGNEQNISFLSNPKYVEAFRESKAAVVILEERFASNAPEGMTLLISDNPYYAYAQIAAKFYPNKKYKAHIAKTAVVHKTAKIHDSCHIADNAVIDANVEIGQGTVIGANTCIEEGVIIGKNCNIKSNVTLTHCQIGNDCIIHSGVRIGQDGFGFAPSAKGVIKVEQLGAVLIGDNVEIGSNTCIDRGAVEDTIIGNGTKIDNLVQIGHNVKIGQSCFIVSQAGIAGSTEIGNGVQLGGQVGIAGHIKIGDRAMLAARSGVMSNVEPFAVLGGAPAVPIKQWHRMTAYLKKVTTKKEADDGK
jgi:UDP-3-O-[3-hydroxymyristoyl] glucosamine N-acyltransferase